MRFEAKESIPWQEKHPPEGIHGLVAMKRGVSYLAPKRRMKFWLGIVDWEQVKMAGAHLDVTIHYLDHLRQPQSASFYIDLASYQDMLTSTFSDPLQAIAAALRDMESSRRSEKTFARFTHVGKRICPSCGESIALAAKKCRYCHELVPPLTPSSPSPSDEASHDSESSVDSST